MMFFLASSARISPRKDGQDVNQSERNEVPHQAPGRANVSIRISALVWELPLPRDQKFVLLAYADHASHDGTNMYPSVSLVARKTGYGERAVQKITRALQRLGWLVADGRGPMRTNRWRFPVERLVEGEPAAAPTSGASTPRPAALLAGEPRFTPGVHSETAGGEREFTEGVNPAAPKPSLEPSFEPEEEDESQPVEKRIAALSQLYEQNIGPITPLLADSLRLAAADFPLAWYQPAFAVAVHNNALRWRYVQAVLDGWKRNGFGWKPGRLPGLPLGAATGNPPRHLTVGTQAEPRAFEAVRKFARRHGVQIDGG